MKERGERSWWFQEEVGLCGKCLVVGYENFEYVYSRGEGVKGEEEILD